eukprot:CFRG5074T1
MRTLSTTRRGDNPLSLSESCNKKVCRFANPFSRSNKVKKLIKTIAACHDKPCTTKKADSPLVGARSMQSIQRDIFNWNISGSISNASVSCSNNIYESVEQERNTRNTAWTYCALKKTISPDIRALSLRDEARTVPDVSCYPEDQNRHSTSSATSTEVNVNLRQIHPCLAQATYLRPEGDVYDYDDKDYWIPSTRCGEYYEQECSRSERIGGVTAMPSFEFSAIPRMTRSYSTGTKFQSNKFTADGDGVEWDSKRMDEDLYYGRHRAPDDIIVFSSEYKDQWQDTAIPSPESYSEPHENTFVGTLVKGGWDGNCPLYLKSEYTSDNDQSTQFQHTPPHVKDSNEVQLPQPQHQDPYSNVQLDNLALAMTWYSKGSVERLREKRGSKVDKCFTRNALRKHGTTCKPNCWLHSRIDKPPVIEPGKNLRVSSSLTNSMKGDERKHDTADDTKHEKVKRRPSLGNMFHAVSSKYF